MTSTFSTELWRGIAGIYGAIVAHPFIAGLADGTLPPESFAFYVVQDALYLRQYARALANVAACAPGAEGTEIFARHAAGVVAVEMTLHSWLLADLDIDPAAVGAAEEAPATLAYITHLLAATRGGSYAEGVGAVLPCYWIYGEVGKHLAGRGSPDPRYQRWIDTYGSEEFDAEVGEVIAVTDTLGTELTNAGREHVRRHFRTSSRYEWMFWDMGKPGRCDTQKKEPSHGRRAARAYRWRGHRRPVNRLRRSAAICAGTRSGTVRHLMQASPPGSQVLRPGSCRKPGQDYGRKWVRPRTISVSRPGPRSSSH